jgi:hypothetical protein
MTTPQHTQDALIELMALAIEAADNDSEWLAASPSKCVAAVLAALTAAGYRIIQTDKAEHGDALVQVGFMPSGDWIRTGPKGVLCNMVFDNVQGAKGPTEYEPVWRRVVGNEQDTP